MTYINGLGKNYVEEYKEFGDKIIAENGEILKKAGVTPLIFNGDIKANPMEGLKVEHTIDDEKKEDEEKSDDTKKKSYKPTSIEENRTISNVKLPYGPLNTMYKRSIKEDVENSQSSSEDSDDSGDVGEANNSLLKTDGNDDNDDLKNFIETDFEQGVHINGGGYVYHEQCNDSNTNSINANVMGSYKSKNDRVTVLYGAALEYTDTQQKSDDEDSQNGTSGTNKNGSAMIVAKYEKDNKIFAGGGSVYAYDNNTQLYNIYAGAGLFGTAVTLWRKIQVTKDSEGKTITSNQTDVKFNVLKPKKAGNFPNTVPDLPTPSETQEYDQLVEQEKQEVDDVVNQKGEYGFGLDLEVSAKSNADVYGLVLKHTSRLTKQDDTNKIITITPYVGAYDNHDNSQEGLKLRVGVVGDLDITTANGINITSKAVVDNKRIMQPGSSPQNTFMASLDTTVKKDKLSVNVSGGYINSNNEVGYAFITGNATYTMKRSSLSLVAGYQGLRLSQEDKDKIFHIGARYAVNF